MSFEGDHGELVAAVRANLARVHERIEAAGGDPAAVTVVAVTKGHPVAAVRAALAAGLVDIGESYVQEMVAKVDEIEADGGEASLSGLRWHLIGRLQRNKVRLAAPFVGLWQSVDRLSLAAEVARRAEGAAVLVQVNVSGAEQQGGCEPVRVSSLVEGCRDLGLDVRGLMAVGARGDEAEVRANFRLLRDLADHHDLPVRSMGMSGDLEAAVAEGSTMLRIGTGLFGPRGGAAAVGN